MLTAQEARMMAGPTLEEKVESLLDTVKLLATDKKRELKTGYDHKDDASLWINGGYDKSTEWVEAVSILESLGYEISFYYHKGLTAVDMYTVVRW